MEPPGSHSFASPSPLSRDGRRPLGPVTPDVIIADHRWQQAIPAVERRIVRAARATAAWLGTPLCPTIVLDGDRVVRRLNGEFRGRYKPTNVLTFEPVTPDHGGDIVLAFETVRREAASARRTMAAHMMHLVVHGMLHLAGFDHHHPGDAGEMEGAEARILSRIGVANPWRTGARAS